jgi:hypothetical protein
MALYACDKREGHAFGGLHASSLYALRQPALHFKLETAQNEASALCDARSAALSRQGLKQPRRGFAAARHPRRQTVNRSRNTVRSVKTTFSNSQPQPLPQR